MDHAQFGWKQQPFRSTVNTAGYYSASSHEHALASLNHAWQSREALALIDGDSGTGKTLVALRFLESLEEDVPRLWIPAPRSDRPTDLFQAVLFDLGINHRDQSEQELRLAVTDHLLTNLAKGHPTVLVIDEAQHLDSVLLEEVRLLGNLESHSAKAVFIVLIALPTLRKRLQRAEHAALHQRLGSRCRVEPLSVMESCDYLRHHIQRADTRPHQVMSEEAMTLLAESCKGLPRLLNQAASLSIFLADGENDPPVDVEAVMEATAQLGLAAREAPALLPHPSKPVDAEPRKAKTPRRRSA